MRGLRALRECGNASTRRRSPKAAAEEAAKIMSQSPYSIYFVCVCVFVCVQLRARMEQALALAEARHGGALVAGSST